MNLRNEIDVLIAAYEAARAADRAGRTPATMQAVVNTSAAVSAFIVAHPVLAPKRSGFASRAGQRQYAERRAMAGSR